MTAQAQPTKPPRARGARQRCGAKARTTGKPCRNWGMPNGRCRMHGGKSRPPGPGHPTWEHGRYSKLIGRLERRPDREHLSLTRDIALLDARAEDLIETIQAEACCSWEALRDHARSFDRAPTEQKAIHLQRLLDAIKRRGTANAVWRDLRRLVQERARLALAERTAQFQESTVVLEADLVSTVVTMMDLSESYIEDANARLAFTSELYRLVGGTPGDEGQAQALERPAELLLDSPAETTATLSAPR